MEPTPEKILHNRDKKIGGLGNVPSLYAGSQARTRAWELFQERGVEVKATACRYEHGEANDEIVYATDMLLCNTRYTAVTEVTDQLKQDGADYHAERLRKCRKVPPTGAEGRIFPGALASSIVSSEVETYAKRRCFFVLKPSGHSVKIADKKDFSPKEWNTRA